MRALATIDLTSPSDKGEYVEVKTPAGTVRVNCGLVTPSTGQPVVLVEVEEAAGWTAEAEYDKIMRRYEVRQKQQ